MKICVAGLGIIGGSLCLALKRAGYSVDGWNRSPEVIEYALKNKIIDGVAKNYDYDVVFVALPPKATLEFLQNTNFADKSIVADICGVKTFIEDAVYCRERNFRYVGCHPMAGKEVSGIENACANLFDNANMVITVCEHTDKEALQTIEKLTADMGFKYIVECSAVTHDKKIAYTSQLAHIVSNCYVKDEEMNGCLHFTGGSFQDMTRIAGVDEQVWADLYLENSKNLSKNISHLIAELEKLREAIEDGDRQNLINTLHEGRLRFENNKNCKEDNIFVHKLK